MPISLGAGQLDYFVETALPRRAAKDGADRLNIMPHLPLGAGSSGSGSGGRGAVSLLLAVGIFAAPSICLAQSRPGKSTEIVVTGKRFGEAEVASESELDEDAIADYGADSINELITDVAPLIDGSGDAPVILVNGERIADPRDIRGYPPEALQRLEVLPREAAGRYGYDPNRRVVNLVLKRQFSAWTGEGRLTLPTALGRDGENLSVKRISIAGAARWNAEVDLKRESWLRESARDVPPPPGSASIAGNVFALGSELDPALSALYGAPVTSAAVPADHGAMLALADFLPGAEAPTPRDDAAWRTLLPASRSAAFNAGVTRPVGAVTLSLGLRAERRESRSLLGLAETSFVLPGGSPFSPFAGDARLERLLPASEALGGKSVSTSFGLSGNAALSLGKLRGTIALVYDRIDASSRTMRGFDLSGVAAAIAASDPAVDPFGPLPPAPALADTLRSANQGWSTNLMLSYPLASLPAGSAQLTATGGYQRSAGTSFAEDAAGIRRDRRTDRSGQVRLQINLPVASRRAGFLGALGELGLDLSGGGAASSGAPLRSSVGAGVNWSPLNAISFTARFAREEDAPSDEQRSAPLVETPGVRLYDYRTGTLAEIVQVTGGNPDLARGTRESLSLGGSARPLGGRSLMLRFDYQRRDAKGGIGSLPALTPLVEGAFPGRVVRDASGALVRVDSRPINLARERQQSLRSGITLFMPWGPPIAPRSAPGADAPDAGEDAPPPPLRGGARGRFQLSLNHEWQLENSLLVRDGLPVLDRLRGEGGGQSRHRLQLQAMIARGGSGLRVDLGWQSPYWTRIEAGAASAGDLRFGAKLALDIDLRLDPARLLSANEGSWLRRTRVSIGVANLLGSRQRVRRADGSIPAGYTRDELDPLGRSVEIGLRTRF